jgi:hypothetical protein
MVLREFHSNGHGVSATPENVSRCCHDRFLHPGHLPEGEGDSERAARDFHGNTRLATSELLARGAESMNEVDDET